MVTCGGKASAGMVALVGRGSNFAIVPAAVLCPRVAHRCVLLEPKARTYVTSEYACTQGGWQSHPATAIVKNRWSWSGPCEHVWDEEMGWGDA